MKNLIFVVVVLGVSTAFAEKFKCIVSINSSETSKSKMLWSGTIELKNKAPDSKIIILDGDNSARLWDDVIKGASSLEETKIRLSKYNNKLLFGLTRVDGVFKLSQGYVDTTQKNMGPFEALAWSDLKAKRIGLKNIQRELELECNR
jgi:hypothetical protein